jgi:hypothetical protein
MNWKENMYYKHFWKPYVIKKSLGIDIPWIYVISSRNPAEEELLIRFRINCGMFYKNDWWSNASWKPVIAYDDAKSCAYSVCSSETNSKRKFPSSWTPWERRRVCEQWSINWKRFHDWLRLAIVNVIVKVGTDSLRTKASVRTVECQLRALSWLTSFSDCKWDRGGVNWFPHLGDWFQCRGKMYNND